ncbi:MAG: fibronectin type III domain-containing protein [Elusimicrobia bacterium]|nr:fibronectin type III domain-containing protein [Elusimicrobiota bacterium]
MTIRSVGLLLSLLAATSPAAALGRTILAGHVPAQVLTATALGPAPDDEPVKLSLVVRLDQHQLDQALAEIYGPAAPARRHYLSSAEFVQRFGLINKRQKLKDFAQSNGLAVDSSEDRPESLVVKVSGRSDAVERAFGIRLNHYRLADGQIVRGPASEPSVPDSLAPYLGAVMGLSNIHGLLQPHLTFPSHPAAASGSRPGTLTGSGPGGGLSPSDIKTAYGLSGALDGTGQTAALFELDGYAPSDIALYESQFGLPNASLTFIGVNGAANTLSGGNSDIEVALDIELMLALAPKISRILVYVAHNTLLDSVDLYARIAADNLAPVISSSWGLYESGAGSSIMNAENTIFQQMALQGQTLYVAAGDSGSKGDGSTISVDDPASQPYATGVGGTSLSGTLSPLSITETVWNTGANGGGGGVSSQWTIPSYQVGVPGKYSTTSRNVPDVSLNADPNSSPYSMCEGGSCALLVGGTSAAAPLWASLTALMNQERAAAGLGSFGFGNPTFYAMGMGASYGTLFNDITVGNNGTPGFYDAGTGYDDATGWGSIKANNMIAASVPTAVAPSGLAVLNVWASSITASWSANGNSPLASYRVDAWDSSVGASTTTVITGAVTTATVTGLIPNDTYFLTVGALGGNGLAPSGLIVSTLTAITSPQTTSVGSAGGTLSFNTGNPNNTLIMVTAPPGAFRQPVSVTLGAIAPGALPATASAISPLAGTGIAAKIDLSPLIEPSDSVRLSMTFPASAAAGLDPNVFTLARYDTPSGLWVPLPSSVSGNTVTAYTNHLSLFQIMAAGASASLGSAKAFPNPMRAALGQTSMSFVQLPGNARVRIYTASGLLVRDLTSNAAGMASWDGRDRNGVRASSGVYFVYAQSGAQSRTLTIAVER